MPSNIWAHLLKNNITSSDLAVQQEQLAQDCTVSNEVLNQIHELSYFTPLPAKTLWSILFRVLMKRIHIGRFCVSKQNFSLLTFHRGINQNISLLNLKGHLTFQDMIRGSREHFQLIFLQKKKYIYILMWFYILFL